MSRRSIDTADTDLVAVAYAHDQVGAEFLQGMLADIEIASVVRRAPGFDVPGLAAAGPRDVLVSARDADVAREVLRMEEPGAVAPAVAPADGGAAGAATRPAPRSLAAVLIAVALLAAFVCVAVDVLA